MSKGDWRRRRSADITEYEEALRYRLAFDDMTDDERRQAEEDLRELIEVRLTLDDDGASCVDAATGNDPDAVYVDRTRMAPLQP